MIEQIERIESEARSKIASAKDVKELDTLRVHYLGKKGLVTSILHQLSELSSQDRKNIGAKINQAKDSLEQNFENKKLELKRVGIELELKNSQAIDITLPGFYPHTTGSFHPLRRVISDMVHILRKAGFAVVTGPEIETEYYNFEALNTPEHHPARDLQDTFYINPPVLLRSQTSTVQIRAMKTHKPPLKIISVGRVYRSDYDATHTPMFHQMEGLLVDENVSFSDLKGVMHFLVRHLFSERALRFRPSYFPFTEPSAEVDMQCIGCQGNASNCKVCKGSGWLEIGGCGMVHPNVLNAVDYDIDRFTGFAFGMGIERIAMLKYGMDDIRLFFENDYRMLEQF